MLIIKFSYLYLIVFPTYVTELEVEYHNYDALLFFTDVLKSFAMVNALFNSTVVNIQEVAQTLHLIYDKTIPALLGFVLLNSTTCSLYQQQKLDYLYTRIKNNCFLLFSLELHQHE